MNLFRILICSSLVIFAVIGCGRIVQDKGNVIATIDGEPIYTKDLTREIALNFKRDPMFKITPQSLENQLNIIINRRLLIQEAKKMRLDETERFTGTIETFWEQTLIRDLMLHKEKELADRKQLDEWFSGIRENSDVKIKSEVLKDFKYSRE